jgi:phage baseplate assembly protein W
MDTLHAVLRTIRGEHKARRDHLAVFREFLDHLNRAARRKQAQRTTKALK